MKYSENSSDPYLYADCDVLRNLFELKDQSELDTLESSFAAIRAAELEVSPIVGKFDFPHLQETHRRLFGDVYEWAGQLRQVDISKGDTRFANAGLLQSAGQQLFRQLANESNLRGLPADELSARLGHYLGEINVLHPFREGNGRTQREFIGQLARDNGFRIDWAGVSQEEMIHASIEAYYGTSERLGNLIRSNMVEMAPVSAAVGMENDEPSLEEQLSAQEKRRVEMVEPSLDDQLGGQEIMTALPRKSELQEDEPGMDM